ncbi:Site-specific recombinase [Actinosynnema pretiosum subsp. pretiosum]|nr:Site-specific recombinase [Actinosynnema pretiosum subsp. pretiosum]
MGGMTAIAPSSPTTLAEWIAVTAEPGIPVTGTTPAGGLRFLFYGRASTCEHQDPRTSLAWQLDVSRGVIGGRGTVERQYFEVGCSRQVPLHRRPQMKALLCHIAARPGEVDAVVVGEFERAFFDTAQVRALRAVLREYGVQLWLPEADGPVDFGTSEHQALLKLLAARSQYEVKRARHRVMAAMKVQAREQGRYLGGRPPYGYLLVKVAPHPNRAWARRGVCLQQLAPHPDTAPAVELIFSLRMAGYSVAGIARHLDEQGFPGPSAVDPERNPHRVDCGWSVRSVAEILHNPRYTGRQVWNRTSADRATRSASGRRTSVRNNRQEWVISKRVAHPPLVSEQDFVAVQDVRCAKRGGQADAEGGERAYLLAGRLRCAVCGRVMDSHWSHWSHGRPAYRCRHGYTSARTRPQGAPRNLYLREDCLLKLVAAHLAATGVADRPDPARAARLVAEHDLAFRCDSDGITVLDQSAGAPVQRKARERRAPAPSRQEDQTRLLLELTHGGEPVDADLSDAPGSPDVRDAPGAPGEIIRCMRRGSAGRRQLPVGEPHRGRGVGPTHCRPGGSVPPQRAVLPGSRKSGKQKPHAVSRIKRNYYVGQLM